MPRHSRIQGDLLYHVGSRGVDRQAIFGVIRHDRNVFCDLLGTTVRLYDWELHAYCLMGNHFHLVVRTPAANISAGMQYLKGTYAQWFNTYKPRVGTLFERRFWYRIPTSERFALELARYVALNPVRAGLVSAPEEWQWSSYAATAGLEPPSRYLKLAPLLDRFGGGPGASARFVEYVREGLGGVHLSDGAEGFADGV